MYLYISSFCNLKLNEISIATASEVRRDAILVIWRKETKMYKSGVSTSDMILIPSFINIRQVDQKLLERI